MTVKTGNQLGNNMLEIIKLIDLCVPKKFYMFKPSNKLKVNSFFLDSTEYIKRALKIITAKGDLKSIVIISQGLDCSICSKPLVSDDNLQKLVRVNEEIVIDSNEIESSGVSVTNSLLNKYSNSNWSDGIQLGHLVPLFFTQGTTIKYLEELNNIIALHSDCHKIKTKFDHDIINSYRNL
jgi:hypothetical protein